jgi:hypothetical protein
VVRGPVHIRLSGVQRVAQLLPNDISQALLRKRARESVKVRKMIQQAEAEDIAARLHQAQVSVSKALGTYVQPTTH